MSEHNTSWPTVDELPRDELGLIVIPKGYPDWYEAEQLNRQTVCSQLANKANIGRPELYQIELVDGYIPQTEGCCYYFKNAFGEVTVKFSIQTEDNQTSITSAAQNFFILPEGFRPKYVSKFPIAAHGRIDNSEQVITVGGTAHLYPDGSFTIYLVDRAHVLHGETKYLASD